MDATFEEKNGARIRAATIGAMAFAIVFPSLFTWVYFVGLSSGEKSIAQWVVYSGGKVIQFSFPVVFVYLVMRSQLRPSRPRFAGLRLGLGFGLVVSAAMFVLYYGFLRDTATFATAALQLKGKLHELSAESAAAYIVLALFLTVLHSLLEEYYWRWFVFGRLRQLMPFAGALVIASLGFMAHHVIVLNHYFKGRFMTNTLPFSIGIGVGGAVWAWLYEKTGSIWSAWLSHLFIDAAIFVIGWDMLGRA